MSNEKLPIPSQYFPKNNRLLKAQEFEAVFNKAQFKKSNDLTLLLARANDLSIPRLGLVVAKKKIPKAVNRNRFKRVVREVFRLNKDKLKAVDIIVLARKDIKDLPQQEISSKLLQLLKVVEKGSET
jgi:ribonuclease P protein component